MSSVHKDHVAAATVFQENVHSLDIWMRKRLSANFEIATNQIKTTSTCLN